MTPVGSPSPSFPPATSAPAAPSDPAVRTAKAFEAVFLGQMTQMMMSTVESGGPFGGGHGEEMFRGVMAEKMGAAITDAGGIGLSAHVLAEIVRLQGGSDVA